MPAQKNGQPDAADAGPAVAATCAQVRMDAVQSSLHARVDSLQGVLGMNITNSYWSNGYARSERKFYVLNTYENLQRFKGGNTVYCKVNSDWRALGKVTAIIPFPNSQMKEDTLGIPTLGYLQLDVSSEGSVFRSPLDANEIGCNAGALLSTYDRNK